ncbi:MAG TPA: biopolymer transporter ExbD [bacterium]
MIRIRREGTRAVPVDIAPLIDMVFNLLLFFMLTSSFVLHPSIRVSLPQASTAQRTSATSLIITLTKEHLVYVNDGLVTFTELETTLERTPRDTPVLIRADQHAFVEKLVELWDLCRRTGYERVHIATLAE